MSFAIEYMNARTSFLEHGGWFENNDFEDPTIVVAAKVVRRNMVEVAVAYCNRMDEPDLAIGEAQALDKFMNCQTILLKCNTKDSPYLMVGRFIEFLLDNVKSETDKSCWPFYK